MINEKMLNYQITKLIGKGGMAEVYEAQHDKFENRKVAIKILNPILTANEIVRKRFENEATIMARLEHPNIVQIIDFVESKEKLAFIMELLEGDTLSDYIRKRNKLTKKETIYIFNQILDAFDFAHSKNVIHRDVKPSNIFIETSNENTAKILDFGIAKLISSDANITNTGIQMGTPVYMSPEQVKDSKRIDARSDIYSLGIVLYYMLAGKAPYDTTTTSTYEIYNKIVNDKLPELTAYPELNRIIQKATTKLTENRFQTCSEFALALKQAESGEPFVKNNNKQQAVEDNDYTQIDDGQSTFITNDDVTIVETDPETEYWEHIKKVDNVGVYKNYLQKYPRGKYQIKANQRIAQLNSVTSNEQSHVQFEQPQVNTYNGLADKIKKLHKIYLFLFLAGVVLVAVGFFLVNYTTYEYDSYYEDYYWTSPYDELGVGLVIIGAIAYFISNIFVLVILSNGWKSIQNYKGVSASPGQAIGYLFIPFYNFYWLFIAYRRLFIEMNEYTQTKHASVGFATLVCVLTVIPYVGMINLLLMPILASKIKNNTLFVIDNV